MSLPPPEGVDLATWVIPFGKHNGTRLVDAPADYLEYMVQRRTMFWNFARHELERRNG